MGLFVALTFNFFFCFYSLFQTAFWTYMFDGRPHHCCHLQHFSMRPRLMSHDPDIHTEVPFSAPSPIHAHWLPRICSLVCWIYSVDGPTTPSITMVTDVWFHIGLLWASLAASPCLNAYLLESLFTKSKIFRCIFFQFVTCWYPSWYTTIFFLFSCWYVWCVCSGFLTPFTLLYFTFSFWFHCNS